MIPTVLKNQKIQNLFKLSFIIEILGGFYLDYIFAYLIQKNGFILSLIFVGFFFSFALCGYFVSLNIMKNPSLTYGTSSKIGFLLLGLCLLFFPHIRHWTFFYFSIGGFGFGMMWSERQWIEAQDLSNNQLNSYLSFLQSFITFFNVILGFSISFLLQYFIDIQTFFEIFSILFLAVFFFPFSSCFLPTQNYSIHFHFWKFSFWKNNLFFLIDGATSMLKINLFIMANIFIFHSISHYAFFNSITLILSSLSLFFISHKIKIQHTNFKYFIGLFITVIGWFSFILSLFEHSVPLFIFFIIFYSIGSPIVSSSRHSIVVLGFKTQENSIEGNTILREIILTISRIFTVLFSIFLLSFLSIQHSIILLAFILIFLLIGEYISAQFILKKSNS